MKKLILNTLLLLIGSTFLFSQDQLRDFHRNNNPALSEAHVEIDSKNFEGELSFFYTQHISAYDFDPAELVKITVCLLNVKPLDAANSVYGGMDDFFDWEYNESLNCFRGVQNKELSKGPQQIKIEIVSTDGVPCSDDMLLGFNANIQPAPRMNGVNDTSDDNVSSYDCNSVVSSSINLEGQIIEVYPNPVVNKLNISRQNNVEELNLEVLSVNGKQMHQSIMGQHESLKVIDVAFLPSGHYSLLLKGEKSNKVFSFIKSK